MKQLLIMVISLGLFSCSQINSDQLSFDSYKKWWNKNQKIFVKQKSSKSIIVKSTFKPSELLAYYDFKKSLSYAKTLNFDSIKSNYKCGLNFQITIEAKSKKINLLHHNVENYHTYQKRVEYLNFKISEFVKLKVGGQSYQPILSIFEGYNELSNKIAIHVAFQPIEFNCVEFNTDDQLLRLTFEDPIWGSGTNHFSYKIKDLESLPHIALAQ